jgi:crotonobetainyl-CoA:carnitine CoA-transferase CaiB-like acyl-CoA transferase
MTRPISFGASPCPAPIAAPTFGQHSKAILSRLGCTAPEIEKLFAIGAVQDDRQRE